MNPTPRGPLCASNQDLHASTICRPTETPMASQDGDARPPRSTIAPRFRYSAVFLDSPKPRSACLSRSIVQLRHSSHVAYSSCGAGFLYLRTSLIRAVASVICGFASRSAIEGSSTMRNASSWVCIPVNMSFVAPDETFTADFTSYPLFGITTRSGATCIHFPL